MKIRWFFCTFQVQSEDGPVPDINADDQEKIACKVDWVFKIIMPPSCFIEASNEKHGKLGTRKPSLQIPKSKLSGSREWIANLFSPNKSRNPSCSETPETNSR